MSPFCRTRLCVVLKIRRRLTGVSRGENLTAIRHRYPRIQDYVRSVRGYHRHEEASGLTAARQRRPGSREFRD